MSAPDRHREEMTLRVLKRAVATGLAVGFVVNLAFVALAAVAWAGEYHVYSCRTPAGQVAPTDGWSAPEHPPYDPTSNTCETGGVLLAGLKAGFAHYADTERATWAFEAPAGETVASATLWRAGETWGTTDPETNANYVVLLTGMAATGISVKVFEECGVKRCPSEGNFSDPLASDNRIAVPSSALDSPYLSLSASCGAFVSGVACPTTEGENRYAAMVELFAADIVLSQPTAPTVSAVSGGLAEDPSVSGTSDVAFHAADSGSGVYEATVAVENVGEI